MTPQETPLEGHALNTFQSDPRLTALRAIHGYAKTLSIEYGKDSAKYPPGHSKYSPFFSGQYSTVVGDNLKDLLDVIEGRKNLSEAHFIIEDIRKIRRYVMASYEELIPHIGQAEHQKAVDLLEEIAASSDFAD